MSLVANYSIMECLAAYSSLPTGVSTVLIGIRWITELVVDADGGFCLVGGAFSKNDAAKPIITTTKMIESTALLNRLSCMSISS
jgi:hypothetical protein